MEDGITGYVERITFQNAENGYTVAKLQQPKHQGLTCIVGMMPALQPGETLHCKGKWSRHVVHGNQFEVTHYSVVAPADIKGIEKYLGSGLIKGIGPVYATRIVEMFGKETLDIIDQQPEKLLSVSGLGKKRLESIVSCWNEQKSIREVMIFLQSKGVSPSWAQKIYKVYRNASIQRVKENPYTLARDIFGIGFKTADKIAKEMGIEKTATLRIDSGIEFVLSQLSNEGHVCFPLSLFFFEAANQLECDTALIEERIQILQEEKRVIIKELVHEGALQNFIWISSLHYSERGIAYETKRLLFHPSAIRSVDTKKALSWVQEELCMALGENQKLAVAKCLAEKMHIITGGPGTGKSTITNAIIRITELLTNKILLTAPTGRAAKRMTEITKKKAFTIHSLLEFDFRISGFKKNRNAPLDCDLIIIDEASMIDTPLMHSLLKAIPDHARIIFVGDINQLPSVGPGNVLKDMISSKCCSVTMLTEIFRQGAGSRIVSNAHLINKGIFPEIHYMKDSDFYFIEANEPEKALQNLVTLVTQRIPLKYRFDPINEIQVLSPMKRGILGTENLNDVLQAELNPNKDPLFKAGKRLAVGDKIMQMRNNYKKKVYNGDVGRIKKIHLIDQTLMIAFDHEEILYDFKDLDELSLAYAVSIHKYQGSESPCIVLPFHTSQFKLLHRNLLYTGITRGKKLVVLVGSKKAIGIAVRNDEVKKRYTGLKSELLEKIQPIVHFT